MKIQELIQHLKNILDDTQNTVSEIGDKLYEMADPASEIKKNIRNLSPQIFEHIYKIIVYSKYPKYQKTAHHWAAEISGALVKFCRKLVKGKNKPLNVNSIVESLISKYMDAGELQDIIFDCKQQYTDVDIKNIDFKNVYERILKTLPSLVQYVQSIIDPDVNVIEEIVKKEAL